MRQRGIVLQKLRGEVPPRHTPFHGGNRGSIPLERTKQRLGRFFPTSSTAVRQSIRAGRVRPRGSVAPQNPASPWTRYTQF